ncbi:hypothetical protein CWI36_2246p0010 [Hamiltosporidium magnivora]|uniref:H/ACA ribonucleoprotein complex subunit NOP10 n=1 Tax=Hamiltosporidium magnivora TaxID=148818 RepID=A0A4Q9KVY9_9MICR|nr:hypothetical protein CWI36_2246p0010 [Hamiltosporidium magnivora]
MSENQNQDEQGNNGEGKNWLKIILTIVLVIIGISILGFIIYYLMVKYGSSSSAGGAALAPKSKGSTKEGKESKESSSKDNSSKDNGKDKESALIGEPLKQSAESMAYSSFHPESNIASKEEKSEKKKKGAKSALHEGFDIKNDLFAQKERGLNKNIKRLNFIVRIWVIYKRVLIISSVSKTPLYTFSFSKTLLFITIFAKTLLFITTVSKTLYITLVVIKTLLYNFTVTKTLLFITTVSKTLLYNFSVINTLLYTFSVIKTLLYNFSVNPLYNEYVSKTLYLTLLLLTSFYFLFLKCPLKMLYHYLEDNIRKYTLKENNNTIQSHPCKFSPVDELSEYRVVIKKRFKIKPFEE